MSKILKLEESLAERETNTVEGSNVFWTVSCYSTCLLFYFFLKCCIIGANAVVPIRTAWLNWRWNFHSCCLLNQALLKWRALPSTAMLFSLMGLHAHMCSRAKSRMRKSALQIGVFLSAPQSWQFSPVDFLDEMGGVLSHFALLPLPNEVRWDIRELNVWINGNVMLFCKLWVS